MAVRWRRKTKAVARCVARSSDRQNKEKNIGALPLAFCTGYRHVVARPQGHFRRDATDGLDSAIAPGGVRHGPIAETQKCPATA